MIKIEDMQRHDTEAIVLNWNCKNKSRINAMQQNYELGIELLGVCEISGQLPLQFPWAMDIINFCTSHLLINKYHIPLLFYNIILQGHCHQQL